MFRIFENRWNYNRQWRYKFPVGRIGENYEKKNSDGTDVDNEVSLNEAEQRVISYISQKSNITIKELVEVSGYSDGYIRKILFSLKEKKVIERQGGNKTGKWVVIS